MKKVARLKILSRLENIVKVETMVETFCLSNGIAAQKIQEVRLASVEAVTNAIEHGNNLDAQKEVSIEVHQCDMAFKLSIKDEGNGFNPEGLPDPTLPEFIEQPEGRGVFLMKKLADEVRFSDGGRCVEMKFLF